MMHRERLTMAGMVPGPRASSSIAEYIQHRQQFHLKVLML